MTLCVLGDLIVVLGEALVEPCDRFDSSTPSLSFSMVTMSPPGLAMKYVDNPIISWGLALYLWNVSL